MKITDLLYVGENVIASPSITLVSHGAMTRVDGKFRWIKERTSTSDVFTFIVFTSLYDSRGY